MEVYDAMPFDIPYGEENAQVLMSDTEIASAVASAMGNGYNLYQWDATNVQIGDQWTRHGFWRQLSVSQVGTITYDKPEIGVWVRAYWQQSGYWACDFYLRYSTGSITNSQAICGQYHNIVGNITAVSFASLIGYRDDEYVYLWQNVGSPSPYGATTYLGYIGNPCKIPLNFFYANTAPDAPPDPDPIYYTVSPVFRKTTPPNTGGGISGTDGGPPDGEEENYFDDTSDPIPVPAVPKLSAVGSGMVNIFSPSQQQVSALNNYLWTGLLDVVENFKKIWSNPMEYFISFSVFPLAIQTSEPVEVKLGLWNSGVKMPPVESQYFTFDCGTIFVQPYWGSALDYLPYTKIQLMLPFIGCVHLNTDEVMNKSLQVTYHIDLYSGNCVALVSVDGSVMYQFTGACNMPLPLTSSDWSRVYGSIISASATALTAYAGVTSGIAAAKANAMTAETTMNGLIASSNAHYALNNVAKYSRGAPAAREGLKATETAMRDMAISAAQNGARLGQGIRSTQIAEGVSATVGAVMGAKASVNHSSTITGTAGVLGVRQAYIIMEYPNQSLSKGYQAYIGYPSNVLASVGGCEGFTMFEQVSGGISGTDEELAEILTALKTGVYV